MKSPFVTAMFNTVTYEDWRRKHFPTLFFEDVVGTKAEKLFCVIRIVPTPPLTPPRDLQRDL